MATSAREFDQTVGRISGNIYTGIVSEFQQPPLMLIQPVTFKVRRVLEHFTDIRRLSIDQKHALADEIRVAIVPMLFSYEIDPNSIERLAPIIESAVFQTLIQEAV